MVLRDFEEPLNKVSNLQYVERIVLHIENIKFIPNDTELILLFIQLQDTIIIRDHAIYIAHI